MMLKKCATLISGLLSVMDFFVDDRVGLQKATMSAILLLLYNVHHHLHAARGAHSMGLNI